MLFRSPEAQGEDTTPAPEAGEAAQAEDQEQNEAGLPDWAREELTSARREAERYREVASELRESLAKATSPEDYQAVSERVVELEAELHRERLARTYHLPEALARRITGETDREREADAKQLAEVFNARTVSLGRGGLDPTSEATPTNPADLARLIPRSRH